MFSSQPSSLLPVQLENSSKVQYFNLELPCPSCPRFFLKSVFHPNEGVGRQFPLATCCIFLDEYFYKMLDQPFCPHPAFSDYSQFKIKTENRYKSKSVFLKY